MLRNHFSTPADCLSNTVATMLAMLSIQNKPDFTLYWYIFSFCLMLMILSIVAMATKDINNKFSRAVYFFVNKIGSAKILFSIIYLVQRTLIFLAQIN